MKNKTTNSLPAHVKCNNCVLSVQKEICLAFNKHFAGAGNLFKNMYTGPTPINSVRIYTL